MKSVKREEPASRLFVSLIIDGVILASLPCCVNDGIDVYYGTYRQFLRFFKSSPWAFKVLAVSNKTAATS